MRKIVAITVIVISIILLGNLAIAEEFEGWDVIRPALQDGDGAEFVVEIDYGLEFSGDTEFDKVLAAANWVAYHMDYENDPDTFGDVWTSSDELFGKITIDVENSGTGDCEDFSILLCALMRFVVGVPANRVWVQGGTVSVPGNAPEDTPPIFGHAYVVYKAEKRGIFYIEPQWGGFPYRGSYPSVTFFDNTPPMLAGESAMLRFNDEWVKGGGFWLAGPKEKKEK
jgi:transglutaminase-like putative cysteine protease